MKMHFSNEWLRRTILDDLEEKFEVEAGPPLLDATPFVKIGEAQEEAEAAARKKAPTRTNYVLNMTVHRLCSRDNLSLDDFAEQMNVDASELRQIDADSTFVPSPHVIQQIAAYMDVPTYAVQRMAGGTDTTEENRKEGDKFSTLFSTVPKLG